MAAMSETVPPSTSPWQEIRGALAWFSYLRHLVESIFVSLCSLQSSIKRISLKQSPLFLCLQRMERFWAAVAVCQMDWSHRATLFIWQRMNEHDDGSSGAVRRIGLTVNTCACGFSMNLAEIISNRSLFILWNSRPAAFRFCTEKKPQKLIPEP